MTGRIDKSAMGRRDEKSKPKKVAKVSEKKNKKSSNISFKGGNLFDEKFDETLIYRPKTQ